MKRLLLSFFALVGVQAVGLSATVSYIQSRDTLQSGTTIYISSGRVNGQFTAGTYQGGGLATCGDGTHALSWGSGSFGCQALTTGSGGGIVSPGTFTWTNNYGMSLSTLTVNSQNVCLEDGTDCPVSGSTVLASSGIAFGSAGNTVTSDTNTLVFRQGGGAIPYAVHVGSNPYWNELYGDNYNSVNVWGTATVPAAFATWSPSNANIPFMSFIGDTSDSTNAHIFQMTHYDTDLVKFTNAQFATGGQYQFNGVESANYLTLGPSSNISTLPLIASSATVSGQLTVGTLKGASLATCGDATHALAWSGGSFSCQEISVPAGTGDNLGSGVGTYGVATTTGGFTSWVRISSNIVAGATTYADGTFKPTRIVWPDGTVQVSSPAAGGGSGDITDVIAGFGLTGGAASGAATLSVGTTVAFQNQANTFTSSQTITAAGGLGVRYAAQVGSMTITGNELVVNGVRMVFPSSGTVGNYLRYVSTNTVSWDAAGSGAPGSDTKPALAFNLDGGGVVISSAATSLRRWSVLPYAVTVSSWNVTCDSNTTTISISVSTTSWSGFKTGGPAAAGSICASACPSLTSGLYGASGPLTGWTTSLSASDVVVWDIKGTAPTVATACKVDLWVQ